MGLGRDGTSRVTAAAQKGWHIPQSFPAPGEEDGHIWENSTCRRMHKELLERKLVTARHQGPCQHQFGH